MKSGSLLSERTRVSDAVKAAFPYTIPTLTGFLVLGVTYGILMSASGYGFLWPAVVSAVAYCGSMQFAAVPLFMAGFDPLQVFLLSLMVNARHIFYGISMLGKYSGLGRARIPLIYTLCDETFSVLSVIEPPNGIDRRTFYLAVSLLDYFYWVGGSLIGGLMGGFIVGGSLSLNFDGLDFVLTALFTVMLTEQLKKRENFASTAVGIAASIAALVIFGADSMVIPAMAIIVVALLTGRRIKSR